MKRSFLSLLLLIAVATGVQAQTRLVEKVGKLPSPDVPNIPYSKYVLDNGLTLIITEDHSDPIVHLDVTYHVGSAREELKHSGFAHFFEHMMFQGSKNVGDDLHFKTVQGAGGTMNGTTNRDRTNYFETVPKNYLETVLWLEADRMGFLLDAVNQKKFEVQRATVKNEKGQNYDNRPYGRAGELGDRSLYPFAHPYAWQTIGYIDDLNRVNVEDLKKFFLRWYGPNNAVVTVGGDINTEDVVKLVEKYFGPIPRGPEVTKATPEFFNLDKDRYVSYEDNVRFPMFTITFPTVAEYHEDQAALDILADMLGKGKASVLYQAFVKTKKAVDVSVSHDCSELSGEFSFTVRAYPGTKLSEIDSMTRAIIQDFVNHNITDEDLKRAKGERDAEAMFSMESIAGKVSRLAHYEVFAGTPKYILRDLDRYFRVQPRDIVRVYETYIRSQHGLYLSVIPKGKTDLLPRKDNYKAGGDSTKFKFANYDTLKVREVKDNFDRSKMPKPGPAPMTYPPLTNKSTSPTGLRTVFTYNNEIPVIFMKINIRCGRLYQPKGKEGIAYALANLLNESTFRLSAEEVANEFQKLGTRISIYPDNDNIVISLRMLKKNLMPTMGLLNEVIAQNKFDSTEFARIKKQQLELIANQSTQAVSLANNQFAKLIYGDGHPLGIPMLGTKASVESLSLADLKGYHEKYFNAKNAELILAGDVNPETLQMITMMMGAFRPMGPPSPDGKANDGAGSASLPQTPDISKTKIYLVNKDKAPQSEIRVGYLSMPYDGTSEFFKAGLMNYALGGSFNSRINMSLRETHGWTYGARSSFDGGKVAGPFTVSAGVRANTTDSAVAEIMSIMDMYRKKGLNKDEVKTTKSSYLEREALKYETLAQKAGFIERVADYNLGDNVVKEQTAIIKKISKKQLSALAKKDLPIEKMVIVITGDAASLKDKLAKLGYEVEVINPNTELGNK